MKATRSQRLARRIQKREGDRLNQEIEELERATKEMNEAREKLERATKEMNETRKKLEQETKEILTHLKTTYYTIVHNHLE